MFQKQRAFWLSVLISLIFIGKFRDAQSAMISDGDVVLSPEEHARYAVCPPKATSEISQKLILSPEGDNTAKAQSHLTIVDSLGEEYVLCLDWRQFDQLAWMLTISDIPGGMVTKGGGGSYTNVPLTFDGSGKPKTFNGSGASNAKLPDIEIAWDNDADDSVIALHFGKIGQEDGVRCLNISNTVSYTNRCCCEAPISDGQVAAKLVSVKRVGGQRIAYYENGLTQVVE